MLPLKSINETLSKGLEVFNFLRLYSRQKKKKKKKKITSQPSWTETQSPVTIFCWSGISKSVLGVFFLYPKNYLVTFQANPSGALDDGRDKAERQTGGL